MHSKRLRADLALGFTALIWGSTFVVVKNALADVSVFMYLAVRFALAAAVMAIVFWRSLRGLTRGAIWAGVQIGFFMFAGYAFQTTGLKFTSPSKAAFITGSSVVIVPLMLAVFGKRRVNVWIWAGALAALAGLYFLTVPPEGLGGLNRGDPVVFGCAVMFALHMIVIGRYVEHHSVGALAVIQVATTALLSTIALPLLASTGIEHPRWERYTRLCGADHGHRLDRLRIFRPNLGAAVHFAHAHRNPDQPRTGLRSDHVVVCCTRASDGPHPARCYAYIRRHPVR